MELIMQDLKAWFPYDRLQSLAIASCGSLALHLCYDRERPYGNEMPSLEIPPAILNDHERLNC